MKTVAVLPCFNEQESIAELVLKTNSLVGASIVADDNSDDETVSRAKQAGAYVVKNFGKRGFGSNSKTGIDHALAMGCDIIVTLDGDGQHDPKEVYRLLEPIENGEADVVIGSRFLEVNGMIPKYREFGIKVITWLCNVGHKTKFSDAQCCFRAYKREVLEDVKITEGGFTFSIETLVKARAMGFHIKEVPITVLYHRQFSRNSTRNPIIHGVSVALGTVKVRLKVELLGRLKGC